MSDQKNIDPPKITKPIQLLAAWLAGLIVINGSFLGAAAALKSPEWASAALVVASIVNVPVFLACLFLLQTKFRPEMQEDVYYSKYLEINTGKLIVKKSTDTLVQQLRSEISENHRHNSELLSTFESSLKLIALKIDGGESSEGLAKKEIMSIVDKMDRSAKLLEAKGNQVVVNINDLVPDYESIQRELQAQGMRFGRSFGSSSAEPVVPEKKIIGFGPLVPVDQLRVVVQICQKFGFNLIHYADKQVNERRIYIGSYIYRAANEPQAVPVTSKILAALNADDSTLEDVVAEIESARR
ncbi:hypothetical protein SD235_13600 [Burkholderia cepacia]|uniref:hypothetical protein n=1 Tax=Burkholderia cepacia TaxID=292 RepID=UPI003A4D611B